MNRNYSPKLLRNFLVNDFLQITIRSFFKSGKEFTTAWQEASEGRGWEKASALISHHEAFDDEKNLAKLEKIFYDELFYNVPDTSYLFKVLNHKESKDEALASFKKIEIQNCQINNHNGKPNEFQLIHTKYENDSINLLFRSGISLNDEYKQIIFTISCIINLEQNYMQINFKKDIRNKCGKKLSETLKQVIDYITNLNIIQVQTFYPAVIKEKLFLMFKEESDRADLVIKQAAGEDLFENKLQSAKDFLEQTFEVDENQNEYFSKYINRLMSIPYHQFALTMTDGKFGDRFMFAFSFYDGKNTRSITRNSDKNHVYTGNLYWVLKDLIIDKRKISSISMFYKISSSNFDLIKGNENYFIEVNINECTTLGNNKGCINIDFLQNKKRRDSKRRIKNEYILREIKKHFPFNN